MGVIDSRSSRFARLQGIQCSIAGKNLYMRFSCSTGDAMGMNMVSKGVQNVLDYLQGDFPDMDVIGISGEFTCLILFVFQSITVASRLGVFFFLFLIGVIIILYACFTLNFELFLIFLWALLSFITDFNVHVESFIIAYA